MNFEAMAWAARRVANDPHARLVLLAMASEADAQGRYRGLRRTYLACDPPAGLELTTSVQRLRDGGYIDLVGMHGDEPVWQLALPRATAPRP